MSELYEELPADSAPQEDLYEDLPSDVPTPSGPEPPPLSTMPPHKTASARLLPAIPQRAPATMVTTPSSPKVERSKVKPPPPPKKNTGGGGGGLNMSEIQVQAKRRSGGSALDSIKDLEEKIQHKGKTDEDAPPPWAGQLQRKKTPGASMDDNKSATSLEEKSELEKRFSLLSHNSEVSEVENPPSVNAPPSSPPPPSPLAEQGLQEGDRERPLSVAKRQVPPKAQPPNTPPMAVRQQCEPNQASGKAEADLPLDAAEPKVTLPKPLPRPKPVQLPPKPTPLDHPTEPTKPAASHPKPPPKPTPLDDPTEPAASHPKPPSKPTPRSAVQQVDVAAPAMEPEQKVAQLKPIPEPKQKVAQPKPIPEPEQKAAEPKPIPEPEQNADTVKERSHSQFPMPLKSGSTSSPKADKPRPPTKPRLPVEGSEPIPRPALPPKQPTSGDGNEQTTSPTPPPSDKPIPDKPLPSTPLPSNKPDPLVPRTAVSSPVLKRQWPPSQVTTEEKVPPKKLAEKANCFHLPPPETEQMPPSPPPPSPSPSPSPPTSTPLLPAPSTPIKTTAEPTPMMGPLLKFRRRSLEMVDSNKPPPLPSRNTKPGQGALPTLPTKNAPPPPPAAPMEKQSEADEDQEELYEDTIINRPAPVPGKQSPKTDGDQEEFYEDAVPPPPGSEVQEELYEDTVLLPPSAPPSASETDQERDGEEGGAVTEELYEDIKQQAPPTLPQKAPPSQPQKALPPPPPPPKPPGPPTVRPPSIPFTAEEEEEMEREANLSSRESEQPGDETDKNSIASPLTLSATSLSMASLQLPTLPEVPESPSASPTSDRKALSKSERQQMKEEKKRRKEKEKEEKEEKKKKEAILKTKQKCLKLLKQYPLTMETQPLFAVELLLDHPIATKDHIAVMSGEVVSVLLMTHEKLPKGKYIVEKSDGIVGYLNINMCQRVTLQQASNSVLGTALPIPDQGGEEEIDQDIYESLGGDEVRRVPAGSIAPPPLPSLPPPNARSPHVLIPPPSHPAPPPPVEEETYESLPEESDA